MSAVVAFTGDEPWFTNSRSWSIILDFAMSGMDGPTRDEYEWYLDTVGLDFESVPPTKRAEVSTWFSAVIRDLRDNHSAEHGWATDDDHRHFQELIDKLQREAGTPH